MRLLVRSSFPIILRCAPCVSLWGNLLTVVFVYVKEGKGVDCTLGPAEGYSTSYMDPYGAMRTSNPLYRDPEESAHLPLGLVLITHCLLSLSTCLPANAGKHCRWHAASQPLYSRGLHNHGLPCWQ